MRVVIAVFGIAIIGLAGWMLFDLHAARSPSVVDPRPVAESRDPMTPPPPVAPPPAIAVPSRPPIVLRRPPPINNGPGTIQAQDPVASTKPMDSVVMGKTRREWRHYYGERQRAIQEEMFKYEQTLDLAADPSKHVNPEEVAEAQARMTELKQRMRDDLVELTRIEASH